MVEVGGILGFLYRHLAVAAVEAEGEAPSVVEEEKLLAVLDAMMLRAHSQFVSDAVPCAHQFGILSVSEFIGGFGIFRSA